MYILYNIYVDCQPCIDNIEHGVKLETRKQKRKKVGFRGCGSVQGWVHSFIDLVVVQWIEKYAWVHFMLDLPWTDWEMHRKPCALPCTFLMCGTDGSPEAMPQKRCWSSWVRKPIEILVHDIQTWLVWSMIPQPCFLSQDSTFLANLVPWPGFEHLATGRCWISLWWTNSLQWKMAIEIVDFPINSMVIFHSKMLVHQRVSANHEIFLRSNYLGI